MILHLCQESCGDILLKYNDTCKFTHSLLILLFALIVALNLRLHMHNCLRLLQTMSISIQPRAEFASG